jgi:hypothetical protein
VGLLLFRHDFLALRPKLVLWVAEMRVIPKVLAGVMHKIGLVADVKRVLDEGPEVHTRGMIQYVFGGLPSLGEVSY